MLTFGFREHFNEWTDDESQYFLTIFAVSCDNIEYLKSICLSVCNLVTIQISPQTPISMENICHFLHKTDGDDEDDKI